MTGKVGFLMLVHASLSRAAQVAEHWSKSGCPVVIHIDGCTDTDKANSLRERLSDVPDIRFIKSRKIDWGTWSLVDATVAGAQQMLDTFPEVEHVFLASGSCLPLRPIPELRAYLARHPGTDFIESVTTPDVTWTVGGLDVERFAFRFPFSWRKNRWLFDRYVDLQRRVGFRRRLPKGLIPHLGSQWWCLTRQTLTTILSDANRPTYDRYFRRVWIPDESYFQTLARLHSNKLESRSLTLSKFDYQGKPHIFYDDHLQLLRKSDCFVARKIWPQAEKLYANFLSNDPHVTKNAEPNPGKIDKLFSRATERRTHGRTGLRMQSRVPKKTLEIAKTCASYSVLEGFGAIFDGFTTWLEKTAGGRIHGHLFAPDRVHFAGGENIYNGALSDSAALRDYDPDGFLINLLWNTRGEQQCFQFGPGDNQAIGAFMASDRNARFTVISGAWAVPLFKSSWPFDKIRAEAARLQAVEAKHLAMIRNPKTKAQVRVWTLAEFIEAPMEPLQAILDDLLPHSPRRLAEAPHMVDLAGFSGFLQRLRNEGMNPYLLNDFPAESPDMMAASNAGQTAVG